MSTAPVDQAVRDRLLNELDTSFFLEAGAGAGKTSLLVGRVIELVRSGRAELREIVAITFTEKAAGELRGRVRTALSQAQLEAGGPEAAVRLRRALEQVDAAHIETIHAFAASMLRERPFEARIDPKFDVLDALATELDAEEAWTEWLWRGADAQAQSAVQQALIYGIRLQDLREASLKLNQYRDLNPPQEAEPPGDPHEAAKQWIEQCRTLIKAYSSAQDVNKRHCSTQIGRAEAFIETLEALKAEDPADFQRRLIAVNEPKPPPGSVRKEELVELREQWLGAAEERLRYRDAVRSWVLNGVVRALARFVQDDAERRRRQATLTFDDLLLTARGMLVRQRSARDYFRSRYRYLLIDEFQDTDPLQTEIVLLIASEHDTADWREARPAPGKLLVVGDPKQSIYRFRRADIDIFTQVEELFAQTREERPGAAAIERLEVNFRSLPALVDWYNGVCPAFLVRDEQYPRAQARYEPMRAHRSGVGPAVAAAPTDPPSFPSIREAREAEAELVAKMILALVQGRADFGALQDQPGEPRTPQFRDIAVLVNNRTALDLYIEQLELAQIPYHHDSGRGFFELQEVRDLTAILTALDDPSNEVAVLAALKTPPWSLSDQELFDYAWLERSKPARFSIEVNDLRGDFEGPSIDALRQLAHLREGIHDRSLPEFVAYVLRESHLLESQFLPPPGHRADGGGGSSNSAEASMRQPRGRRRAANLQMLVQRAADFAETQDDSLRQFAGWLSERARPDLSEAESTTSEAADNVVRILTMHQSKGLEFPIVMLPKLASRSREGNQYIVNRDWGRLEFALGPPDARFKTSGYNEEALKREQAYEDAERRRLLYVAATRAIDWLIVPIAHRAKSAGFHEYIDEALPGWLSDHPAGIPTSAQMIVRPADQFAHIEYPQPAETANPPYEEILAQWQERRREAHARGRPNVRAVTPSALGADDVKLALERGGQDRGGEGEEPRAAARSRSSSSARERGSAIHAAIAAADLHNHDSTLERARRIAEERRVDPNEVLPDVQRALQSNLLQRARAAAEYHFEYPLTQYREAPAADGLEVLEGIADLVFREPHGWVVADFKSDRRRTAAQVEGYRRQVAAYARMLEATGETAHETWLFFTHWGEAELVLLPGR